MIGIRGERMKSTRTQTNLLSKSSLQRLVYRIQLIVLFVNNIVLLFMHNMALCC